jgi:putative Mn2+ efflux pump MntP
MKRFRVSHALRIAFFFGAFQGLMPVAGWFMGSGLRVYLAHVDHWVAFALLSFIGLKMIYESRKMNSKEKKIENLYVLLILSVATSIDALAVGLSLSFLNVSIITPAVVISIVTFLFSFAGVLIGNRLGHFFERKIEVVGGLILILIGLKILIEHL